MKGVQTCSSDRRSIWYPGAFVEYLGEAHPAYHLGQLVAWRAAVGLEPVVRGGDSHAV